MVRLPISAAAAAAVTCLLLPAITFAEEGTKTTPAKAATGEDTPISVPADDGGAAVSATSSGNVARTFVGLAIVLFVIYGLYWVLKQVKASREEATKGDGLATVASIGLGPNRALHLIRAGEDYILVGAGEHAITPIRTYTMSEAVLAGLVPDPAVDDVIDGHATSAPKAALPAIWRKVLAAGGAPGAQLASASASASTAKPNQLTVQALLGSIREKTVRS